MKKQRISVTLCILLAGLLTGCFRQLPADMGETPHEAAQTDLSDTRKTEDADPSPDAVRVYPLADFPSERITYEPCISRFIPKESVQNVQNSVLVGDLNVCVISTSSNAYYAAISAENGYTVFYTVYEGKDAYPYANDIQLTLFSDVFGQSGVMLTSTSGANYGSRVYFTLDKGYPSVLLECSHRDQFSGDILVGWSTSMSVGYFLCMEEEGLTQYSLEKYLTQIFSPDTYKIPWPPFYQSNKSYKGHEGILTFYVTEKDTGKQIDYVGWLENGSFCLSLWENEEPGR